MKPSTPHPQGQAANSKPTRLRSWLSTLSGAKATDNVGSGFGRSSAPALERPKSARAETPQRVPQGASVSTAGAVRTVARSKQAGTATNALAVVGQLPDWLRRSHAADIARAERAAREVEARTDRAWTLCADKHTRAVLDRAGSPCVSAKSEHAYRRAWAAMLAAGHTPLEHATSRAHFDFLRSAARFCLADEIRRARAASDRARKRGDLPSAQRRTRRAHECAVVFDRLFLADDHPIWKDKARALRAQGKKPVRKSKRYGAKAPSADALLLALHASNPKAAARHEVRAAVIALFGCRPAEIENPRGVRLALDTDARGRRLLTAQITGAKVDEHRGQQVRLCGVPVPQVSGGKNTALAWLAARVEANGGPIVVHSTPADTRSLNRALARLQPGLSCYSFRHRVGGELKASSLPEAERAAFMGHRSTASLQHYGRARDGGRGAFKAKASNEVRHIPHTREQKAGARAKHKATQTQPNTRPLTPAPSSKRQASVSAKSTLRPRLRPPSK